MDVSTFLKGAGGRRTETVWLSPDPDALSGAKVSEKADDGGSLADSVEGRREALRDTAWAFTVGTIPGRQWQHLLDRLPATDSQRAKAKAEGIERLPFDVDRFPLAAIAACLVEARNPDGETLTFDGARWEDDTLVTDPRATEMASAVWDTFPLGEWEVLWNTVASINGYQQAAARQSFAAGSAKTRSGGR